MDHLTFSGSAYCGDFNSLLRDALKHLEDLGYNPGTVANYRNTWKEFRNFAKQCSETETFSTDMVQRFLESYGIFPEKPETGFTFRQRHVRNVMRGKCSRKR